MPAKPDKGKKSADTGEKKGKKTRGKGSSTQPSSTQPSDSQPSSTQPSDSQPSASQPSASQPPSRQIRVGLSKAAKKMKPPEIEALEKAAQAEIPDGQEDMIVDGQEDADMDHESTDDTGMKSPAKKTPPKENLPIEASRVKSPTKHPSYSRVLENKFASFFRENECLYDKAHPDYTNSNVKARLKHDFAEKHSTEHPGGLTGIMFCTNFFLFCIVSTLKKIR